MNTISYEKFNRILNKGSNFRSMAFGFYFDFFTEDGVRAVMWLKKLESVNSTRVWFKTTREIKMEYCCTIDTFGDKWLSIDISINETMFNEALSAYNNYNKLSQMTYNNKEKQIINSL